MSLIALLPFVALAAIGVCLGVLWAIIAAGARGLLPFVALAATGVCLGVLWAIIAAGARAELAARRHETWPQGKG